MLRGKRLDVNQSHEQYQQDLAKQSAEVFHVLTKS